MLIVCKVGADFINQIWYLGIRSWLRSFFRSNGGVSVSDDVAEEAEAAAKVMQLEPDELQTIVAVGAFHLLQYVWHVSARSSFYTLPCV